MIGFIAVMAWLSYEVWSAPVCDEEGNVLQPQKKFKDLFKNKIK